MYFGEKSKSCRRNLMSFFWRMGCLSGNNLFDFDADPDNNSYPGIFQQNFTTVEWGQELCRSAACLGGSLRMFLASICITPSPIQTADSLHQLHSHPSPNSLHVPHLHHREYRWHDHTHCTSFLHCYPRLEHSFSTKIFNHRQAVCPLDCFSRNKNCSIDFLCSTVFFLLFSHSFSVSFVSLA